MIVRGEKLNDGCKTMLEVGENYRTFLKSPKFSSVMNFWREKSKKNTENTSLICEHSTMKESIYTNIKIVSAQDDLLKLPTAPNYPGGTKNVNFGGKLNPET